MSILVVHLSSAVLLAQAALKSIGGRCGGIEQSRGRLDKSAGWMSSYSSDHRQLAGLIQVTVPVVTKVAFLTLDRSSARHEHRSTRLLWGEADLPLQCLCRSYPFPAGASSIVYLCVINRLANDGELCRKSSLKIRNMLEWSVCRLRRVLRGKYIVNVCQVDRSMEGAESAIAQFTLLSKFSP